MTTELTPEELAALKQFRQSISDIIERYDQYDSHDSNLIRWLRARDLNVKKAEAMIRKSVSFRKEHEIDDLRSLPNPEHLLKQLPVRPVGHNKQGFFVATVPAGQWEFKKLVLAGKTEELRKYVCQVLEKFFQYRKSVCSKSKEKMKAQAVIIADFQGFSIPEHLSKPVISCAIEMIQMLDQNYPEFIKTVYCVNVPHVFPMGWSIVRPFLSQRTINKFKIIGGGPDKWRKVLLEDIDARELPSEYGGSNTAHPARYTNALGFNWPPRAPLFPPEIFRTEVVPAREKFVKSFELSAGSRISWNFKTEGHDIGFEFTMDGVGMFPYARADAHLWLQDGLVDVTEDGTYALVFDNTYSKYRSKTLHYVIRARPN